MERVDLIVMNGRSGKSDVENMVSDAREAITVDLVQRAVDSGAFSTIIVATNSGALTDRLDGQPTVIVDRDPDGETFHFGRRLQSLIAKYGVHRLVYMGGGSAPLVTTDLLRSLAQQIAAADRLFLANNFYSVDFCGFTPAEAFLSLDAPASDNSLGWLLTRGGLMPARELPRSAETLFDVDTPVDLATLSLHPSISPTVAGFLSTLDLNTEHLELASRVFLDRRGEVFVAGRVSSRAVAYLERETLCRTRVVSEERGMRADGRLARGEVRSLLGMHLETVGIPRFFAEFLPELGRAVFLDDRVIWAHCKVWPETSDRYNSDLLRWAEIEDPFVRSFTRAACSCPIPVVLGGHSLLAGGLLALVDAAWARSGLNVARTVEFP